MLSRLFGRQDADDPRVQQLEQVALQATEAGPLVARFESDAKGGRSVRASGPARDAGALARYTLQLKMPRGDIAPKLQASEPFVQWVRQLILLLKDQDASIRWFVDATGRFKAYSGREVGGFQFDKVDELVLPDLGDAAVLMKAANSDGTANFNDTYVNVRRGPVFASVSSSSWKNVDVDAALQEIARKLVVRIGSLLEARPIGASRR